MACIGFFAALLWESMIRKHTRRQMWQREHNDWSISRSSKIRLTMCFVLFFFFFFPLSDHNHPVDYFLSLMVRAGYVCVAIIHQTLTWTTGSSSCVQMLIHVIANRGVRTPKESLHWKLTLGRKSRAAPVNRTCVKGVTVRRSNPLSCIPSHHTHSACHQWPL